MAGLVPAIHVSLLAHRALKTWMPGTRPGMTECVSAALEQLLDVGKLELDVSRPAVIALA
jgi:hypothetical protein